jgi:tetratricopeptide (TPR) repeat protein
MYKGQFTEARESGEDLLLLKREYQFSSGNLFQIFTRLMLVCRNLHETLAAADAAISFSVETGAKTYELEGLGLKAMALTLMKDVERAMGFLKCAQDVSSRQAFWLPIFLSPVLTAQFMFDLQLLEKAIGADPKPIISEYAKAALKNGKNAMKNSEKVAAHRTENYRLMGVYYWLIDKQSKALKWLDKSIREGERLGARPDLARTYMEIGKRMMEPGSKYREFKGISAAEYLSRSRAMFEEMDLQWDLEQLETVQ